ncbi:MAG TPA: NAD-dependent protein deacylase [Acholeplasmataceae bacterium]|nr:NAD-dependent protein deacylase [Acholeplasmataceae bacterium]
MEEKIKKLAAALGGTDNAVFFGGAGVSVASNIPDFRSSGGLFQEKWKCPPEVMLSRSFFDANPEEFFRFYKAKMVYPDAKPNPAHYALAKLEEMGILKAVITQNIDNLHQAAGSRNVIELHGTVMHNHCLKCGKQHPLSFVLEAEGLPRCACGGIVKPDVVLYEEPLSEENLERAWQYIREADVLIVAGTSLLVNPAASLINAFAGSFFTIINKSPTASDRFADLVIHGDVAEVLPRAVSLLK